MNKCDPGKWPVPRSPPRLPTQPSEMPIGGSAGAANGMALWVASSNGHNDIVKLLKKGGARWPGGGSGPPVPREGTSHTSKDVAMAKLLWNPSKQTRQ
jgi:hypothetical protein